MSTVLETRAEIIKLARVLGTPADQLGYLERATPDDLRALREQATDKLFEGDRDRLHKLALASRLLPSSIGAAIARWALGALLSARVTGLLVPSKAVDMAKHLPASFLADIAVELDPRRAREVIERMPAWQVGEVAAELARRNEHVAMGRFVGFLGDEAITAAMEQIDDAGLLRIAFVMEGKDNLDHVVSLLPEHRLAGVMRSADQARLWPEALDLLDHLSDERKGSLAEIATAEGLLESLAETAHAEGLWDVVLPVIPLMTEGSRLSLARLPIVEDRDALAAILETAAVFDLWAALLPVVDHLPAGSRDIVASLAAGFDQAVLERILAVVGERDMWSILLPLVALNSALQQRLVPVVSTLSPPSRARAGAKARELGLIDRLGSLGPMLG
ncbi:MAG TPA: hypothetical protein VG186_04135 [Solirubrobacteraceae bacterium]|nr:hypothetical protein [Solirubrobacteraceae bacterium]